MKHIIETAKALDEKDIFQPLTHLFTMPIDKNGQTAIYLNGNSLGPKPKSTDQALIDECLTWGRLGVRGHFDQANPWTTHTELVTDSLARLVGAKAEEVVATGTLTANLHFTFVSFYQPTPERFKIIRLLGFPSDTYAVSSQVKQRWETSKKLGREPFPLDAAIVEIKPDSNGYISLETFKKTLEEHGDSTALIWIEAVHYLTGQYFNIPAIAAMAREKGCKIGLDLAHAIGNVPLALHHWEIDFAVWCSYKYLSSGPGGIAGLYVHEKYLTDPNIIRFSGWWGHNKITRFKMPEIFDPMPTAEAWQVSNPGILLLVVLRQSLAIFDQIDFLALREKNKRLVSYLETLMQDELGEDIQIITPHNPEERGCQLSFRMKHIKQNAELETLFFDQGIICDIRGDLARVAPMGLYTSFTELFNFVRKLKIICEEVRS